MIPEENPIPPAQISKNYTHPLFSHSEADFSGKTLFPASLDLQLNCIGLDHRRFVQLPLITDWVLTFHFSIAIDAAQVVAISHNYLQEE